jgi:hypothetical protein
MIATWFASLKHTTPQPFAATWDELCALLSQHRVAESKHAGSLWSPAVYTPGARRGIAGVDSLSVFVADLDGESLDALLPRVDGLDWIATTTWSHRDDDPHWHFVLRLDRSVAADDWRATWRGLHAHLGIVGDPQTCDASRIYFTPQHAPGADHRVLRGVGRAFALDSLPACAAPPVIASRPSSRRSRRTRNCWQDESWWNEPQDLSRFEGMTQQQIAAALLVEFRELRARLGI